MIYTKYLVGLLILSLAFTQCSKDICSSDNPETVVLGKWNLIEVYSDPGDGSGSYEEVESDRVIEFFSDGRIITNEAFCDTNDGNASVTEGIYTDEGIIIESCYGDRLFYTLFFEECNLILRPPCFEGCGEKYVRI